MKRRRVDPPSLSDGTDLLPLDLDHPDGETLVAPALVGEGDETEALGPGGLSVDHDLGVEDGSELGEVLLDNVGGGGGKQTSDEDFGCALVLLVGDGAFGVNLRKRERAYKEGRSQIGFNCSLSRSFARGFSGAWESSGRSDIERARSLTTLPSTM